MSLCHCSFKSKAAPLVVSVPTCENRPVSRADDLFERGLNSLAERLSGRAVGVIALSIYAGGGLAVPLAFQWPVPFLVEANVVSTVIAGVLLLTWLSVQSQARDRRHLLEWTTNLRLLSAEEFEWFVGEMFRREGWGVREAGRQDAADGNIDLELARDGQQRIVQCKRWVAWLVDINEIRKFAGTLMREGLPATSGIFVTLSDFTNQARSEAGQLGIALVDGRELHARAEKVRRPEPCPTCQRAMILDRSPRGWWFRCVAAGCQGKRDLGGEAGAAIEFLTQEPSTSR